MSIALTPSAAAQIQSFLAKQPNAVGLRFGVKNSGCSGFGYVVEVAEAVGEDDEVFESGGVKVVVERAHLEQIDGTEIDYQSDGFAAAFSFQNPNVVDECGCGESFSTRPVSL